jgi:hypothetical protein
VSVVWAGNIDRLVEWGGWWYRFYGVTFGQTGIGVVRRVRKLKEPGDV